MNEPLYIEELQERFDDDSEENPWKYNAYSRGLLYYIIRLHRKLGYPESFGLPTRHTVKMLNFGSHHTYLKYFRLLISYGYIKVVEDSIEGSKAIIVSLNKLDYSNKTEVKKKKTIVSPIDTLIVSLSDTEKQDSPWERV